MHNCWASAFIDILLEMEKVKDKAMESGKKFLSYYHYHKIDKQYKKLIRETYTALGDVECITDEAGRVTRYTYFSQGKIACVLHADGTKEKYAYDRNGNVSAYTYRVHIHFSTISTEIMSDKIKRMLKNEIQQI